MIDRGADAKASASKVFADSNLFEEVVRPLLAEGLSVRFQARGASMSPAIRDGEMVEITPVIVCKLRKDDIVLAKSNNGFRLHRIVLADAVRDVFITRGDCGQQDDPALEGAQILGLARAKEVRVGQKVVHARFRSVGGWMLRSAARVQHVCGKVLGKSVASISPAKHFAIFATVFLSIFAVTSLRAQVAVDSTSTGVATLTGRGTRNLTFTHTTAGTNNVLLVGVAMNITNNGGTALVGVTYNGTPLNFVGAHDDAGGTRRVEMWYLSAPATGTFPIVVSVAIPSRVQIGVVAGATTFTGVDQTAPLGTFVSADGANGVNSQLDVPSVVNGMVLDTLAIGGDQNITTVSGPQVTQWNTNTGGGADPPDVTSSGSSRTGAPSVPVSEVFGASNWSLGAVSVNPSGADIGVTTSVSAVATGQNSTYNITVTNNGPSAANNAVLTDTLAPGVSLVSVSSSAGTSCTGTGPITCTLPTSFASGATATVAVVVKASAAGFYPNTASVTDSGTPPDPNTGNNTYVAVAPVVTTLCASGTPPAGGTLTGVLNTYYPGAASVSAGATAIPIGVANGTGTITAGSELLVIQMQDASISTSDTVAYGNGSTGAGFTAINNAGNYEFVTATGPVSGGSVPILGGGVGGGLVFGYSAAAPTATKGASTYQVVLVPQYTTATLGAATAAAWNGSTGGILALDIGSNLNLGGATVSVNGLGFRGGAGMQLVGGYGGANTDYQYKSPTTYTGAANGATGVDASKGEGVAGTPMWVESAGTFLQTTTGVGYPSGTAGTDGSMARGAPANAGGGGTDANSGANDQNAGGGGGSNGGSGGFGGDSWNTNLSSGGEGGATFPATIDRITMGGGGGAGTRNNSDTDNQASSGAAGGGIVFIRAFTFSGTATITANGAASYNGTKNDAGGGGGAGGTIVMLAAAGGEGGLTLRANGGRGGDAWDAQAFALGQRHGPGGGGGGGVILVSGTPASMTATGGANGTTLTPGVAYGATPGNTGTTSATATMSQVTGIQSSEVCTRLPDLAITKSHGGVTFTRGTSASYTLSLSNVSPLGSTAGLVTVDDTLPLGISPTSASGTGWTCSVSGQTVSCTTSNVLAPGASYPSVTVSASVLQSAPATLTNTGNVSGGGDVSPLNDKSTDVANVASTADMAVTDAASPDPVAAGGNLTYSIAVSNAGPSAADDATLVVPVPTNTTFVSLAAPSGWSCQSPNLGSTGTVVCTDANLAGGSPANNFTLIVKVNSGLANGTIITGNAQVTSSVSDPNSANNSATVTTVVGTSGPNLSVTNVASPNPVQAGSNITYTQVVTNTGSTAITNGTFTEATPANTSLFSITPPAGWTCTGFPVNPCKATTVAANTSGTFTVIYTVAAGTTAGTTISDTVTVNAANQSFGASSAIATDVVATGTQADVALSTAGAPSPVIAGNNITYTQSITNKGPAAAAGLTFTEATPTNTTFQSVLAPAGWTCTNPAVGGTGTVTCTDGSNLGSSNTADIVLVVSVPSTIAAGSITANSSVAATTSDPNPSNNSTTIATQVIDKCDLAVTNSGSPSPVTAGSNITYTQIVTNNGPSNCSTATLTEPTPANTTFVSASAVTTGGGAWSCNPAGPASCSNPSVPPGSTGTITAIYTVAAGATTGTIITDTVSVGTTTNDTNPSNNFATVNIGVAASGAGADLSVTNSGPATAGAGSSISYTQTITNNGPAPATTPTLLETIPTGTTASGLTGPTGWTCTLATLTCTDGSNLAANTTVGNFTLTLSIPPTAATGYISEVDTVSSSTSDPNGGNNSVTVKTYVSTFADLSVTNTASPIGVQIGNNITYTQQVNNIGPSAATTVNLTETLPPNTTAQSLTGTGSWICTLATLTCTDSSLAPSTPGTITYIVKVNSGAPGTQISETVNVTSAVSDPNLTNNTAAANDVVALASQANLVLTNTALPTSVQAGSNVVYTQVLTNTGPAVASAPTFTETTPPNTTYQSIIIPGGWTCPTLPTVGGTGTITCQTIGGTGTIAVNGNVSFTVTLQVNSNTPSGTSITDTATGNDSNPVPGITTNTASATVVVGSANSATLTITKTGSPNPVTQGTPLTYSIVVANTGPSTATTVTVTDSLPTTVTYLSSNATQGTCSEAGGTVTCLLGSIANGGSATITILTLPGTPGTISNTATVTWDQMVNPLSSTWVETVTTATSVKLLSFSAHLGADKNGASRAVLLWRTGGETHNLGFNVYREQNGNRVRINPSIIAGSALLMAGALPKHAARSYAWIDPSAQVAGASYWLEDIDVNGTRTMHGPVSVGAGIVSVSEASVSETRMMSQMNLALPPAPGSQQSHLAESFSDSSHPTPTQIQKQFELAAHPAVKIDVRHEGWYRVGQPELVKAGLDPNVDPAMLHLYAEAVEQPMQITGATHGPGGFGPGAAINFYGTGINTVFSGTRVYWLTAQETRGSRIRQLPASSGSNQPPASYWDTAELQQHTIYFSALITADGQNFFGALVTPTPVDQLLEAPHLDTTSTEAAQLEVSLQGIITGFPHDVAIALNGTPMGDVVFTGQDQGTLKASIPMGALQPWNNTVTLTAQNGDYDSSLVNYIRITYPHLYVADSDRLKFTARAGDEVTVSNFTSPPLVVDITDPNRPVALTPQVTANNGKYAIAVQAPFTTTNPSSPVQHTLLAVAQDRISRVAGLWANHPSHWHDAQAGADIAMVTDASFTGTLEPLVRAHRGEGKTSAIVPIGELYDEFSFGEHTPLAIKQFLDTATHKWRTPPTYLLLNGRASLDPRNYLGFGHLDLVPTRIVPTASLMTASDDWFSDFTNTGYPTIATGRLPVSTSQESATVIGKIAAYEGQSTNGSWTSNALFVADKDDTEDFTQDSQTVQAELPAATQATDVFVDSLGTTGARTGIVNAINSGEGLVNYIGHGSEEQWSGSDIFDENAVNSLTNGSQLPVFLIMNCLNGYFQDVYAQPLGVTLMLASNGGAVGVLASSGLNQATPQTNLDAMVVHNALTTKGTTLGQAVVRAKSKIADPDVRRTFVLLGDPAMQVKRPGAQ